MVVQYPTRNPDPDDDANSPLYDPASRPLFEPMMARYFESDRVHNWLLDSTPKTARPNAPIQAFSYACMYYPSTNVSKFGDPHGIPKPFLDLGDFLIFHAVYDGIAVGTIYTPNEIHALSIIRDAIMKTPKLSNRPLVRNFAMDLRVRHAEIVEFAWMQDHSLIVACRRLYTPSPSFASPLLTSALSSTPAHPTAPSASSSSSSSGRSLETFSADFLFFPVVHLSSCIADPPLLRLTLEESPALCQYCGSVGVGVCRCHPSCKIRAPVHSYRTRYKSQRSSYPPSQFAQSTTSSTWHLIPNSNSVAGPLVNTVPKYDDLYNDGFYDNDNLPRQTAPLEKSFSTYANRIANLNHTGALFSKWYKRSACGTQLETAMTPRHPIPYQFVTGSRTDTLQLVSMYISGLRLSERSTHSDLLLPYPESSQKDEAARPIGYAAVTGAEGRSSVQPMSSSGGNADSVTATALTSTNDDTDVDCDTEYVNCSFDFSDPADDGDGTASMASNRTGSKNTYISLPANYMITDDDLDGVKEEDELETTVTGGGLLSNGAAQKTQKIVIDLDNGIKYRDVSSLNKKEKLKHFMSTYVDDVRCIPCARTFSKRSNLVRHIETKHFSLKPFKCDMCSKRFGHSNHLRRHMAKLHNEPSRRRATVIPA